MPDLEPTAERLYLQLHNLRIVAAVATSGSATAAGQVLFKSTSTVTRGVAAVEEAIGTELFERVAGGLIINASGATLVSRIRRIENEVQLAAESARGTGRNPVSSAALRDLLHSGRKMMLLTHLADTRNVAAAAAAMSITQSGVNMALGRIERALGMHLFFKGWQTVTPTDEVATLVLHAKRMRAELRHAVAELSSAAGSLAGTTVVGGLPMARTDVLPRAIGACLAKFPGVQIRSVEAPGEVLISQLRCGEIDVVLTVPGDSFEPAGLLVETLFGDELAVVVSPAHPLAAAHCVTLDDLIASRWILPQRRSVSRKLFDQLWEQQGTSPPRAAVETADGLMIRSLLTQGDMVALTSLSYVQNELNARQLAKLDVQMAPIRRDVLLLQRDDMKLSTPAASFVDELRRATSTTR